MNQPPPTEKQTGKRIVSKGEYARLIGTKVWLGISSIIISIFAVAFFLCAAGLFFAGLSAVGYLERAILHICPMPRLSNLIVLVQDLLKTVFLLALSGVAYLGGRVLLRLADSGMAFATKDDTLLVLTRANTADLPAPDSLVRASSELEQAQQTMLLRPAIETQERHEEQLVRASGTD